LPSKFTIETHLEKAKGVTGLCISFSVADYMDTLARDGPVVVPNVLLFRETAPH